MPPPQEERSTTGAALPQRHDVRDVARGALLFVAFIVAYRLGLTFATVHYSISPVWPASGVALAGLLWGGRRLWPAVFLASAVAERLFTTQAWWVIAIIATAAAAEPLISATLIARDGALATTRKLSRFVGAVLLSCLPSAVAGPLALLGARALPRDQLWTAMATWFAANSMGVLVLAPLVLAFRLPRLQPKRSALEGLVTLVGLVGVSVLVFLARLSAVLPNEALAFLCFPFLVWMAVRADAFWAVLAVVFVATVSVFGTANNLGPFAEGSLAESVWLLQTFLFVCAVTTYLLSAATHERLAAEQRLRDSETLLEQASRIARVGPWTHDVATDTMTVSPLLMDLLGEQPIGATVPTKSLEPHIRPEDLPGFLATVASATARQVPYTYQMRQRRSDGKEQTVVVSAEPVLDASGKLVRWIGITQDVTEREEAARHLREMEQALQESQRLEALGQLAGGVAHDFNNLLTAILANANLARESPQDAADCLGDIEVTARRAADLCRQMLATTGRARVSLEPTDLAALVRETARLANPTLRARARLDVELPEDVPPVLGDSTQLRQIVLNLLINAAEALPAEGGRIRVSARGRTLDEGEAQAIAPGGDLKPGAYVELEICDTGVGMDTATQRRIFDPFFTTKPSGRGLGLAMVRGMVRAHGGALSVESAPGKGSTFHLLFPQASKVARAPQPVDRQTRAVLPGALLAIDDEEAVLRVVQRAAPAGSRVITARSGREALDRFRAERDSIAVVLLDYTMPGESGADVFRMLRAEAPGVRVVLMSGNAPEPLVAQLREDGLRGYLPKPFSPDQLRAALFDAVR